MGNGASTTSLTGTRIPSYEILCDGQKATRVLIVGGGLTGCLTAVHLRQEWDRLHHGSGNNLELHLWERASYPAGRFGGVTHINGEGRADMGAQCVSLMNPNDHRAVEGMGVTREDIERAWHMVEQLCTQGILHPVHDDRFNPHVEERKIEPGLWKHFWSNNGNDSVLRAIFMRARVNAVQFGIRVDRVQKNHNNRYTVTGALAGEGNLRTPVSREFDYVIITAPAPDAAVIEGVEQLIGRENWNLLTQVGYDSRVARTLIYSDAFADRLQSIFNEKNEVIFEGEEAQRLGLHLMAWQGVKREGIDQEIKNLAKKAVVAHSLHGKKAMAVGAVHEAIASRLGISASEVEKELKEERSINWEICQTVRPVTAILGHAPPQKFMNSRENPGVFMAGDYMTLSSFLGADSSAFAVASFIAGLP